MTTIAPAEWQMDLTIVLDWYDGPREGLCSLRFPRAEFYFKTLAERPTEDGLDDRIFSIAAIPEGTVLTIRTLLAFAGAPTAPVWAPRWESAVGGEIERANLAVARAIEAARETTLIVRVTGTMQFVGVWSVPTARATMDWFELLEGMDPVSMSSPVASPVPKAE